MPVDLLAYRYNLERLNKYFPNVELLTRKDLCAFTGLSRRAIANNFQFSGKYISKANFARILAGTGILNEEVSR